MYNGFRDVVSKTYFNAYFIQFLANCVVMALDEHLPNGDKTILALQLVSVIFLAL